MNRGFVSLVLFLVLSLKTGEVFTQTSALEEMFSAKGTVTDVNADEKSFHAKMEGGLELTFFVNDETVVKMGDENRLFADLGEGAAVEITYFYNDNYEKVAKTITIISAGKTQVSPA